MSFKYFTPENKNELSVLLRTGFKQNEIAKLLKKTLIAICQELKKIPLAQKQIMMPELPKRIPRKKRLWLIKDLAELTRVETK